MAFDIAAFRQHFPEFSDESRYPDGEIEFWATLGEMMLIQCRWGDVYDQGLELYVAHQLTVEARNKKAASAPGGIPGGAGLQSGKTVGSTSVQYDTKTATEEGAGFWNLSTYGQQFYRISRMIGAGALQV